MREALASLPGSSVAGGVIAAAGGVTSVPERGRRGLERLACAGHRGGTAIILDVVAGYAASTSEPRGLVLSAGTGSVAALVDDGQLVRRAGGRGYLVGDEGSAVWLGVEGVRAVVLALDGRGPHTTLCEAIPQALGVAAGSDTATRVTDAVYGDAPAALGALAPVVVLAAGNGDAVAEGLLQRAADHLSEIAVAAAGTDAPTAIVLAGSLLTRVPALVERVSGELLTRWPEATLSSAASGEAGAAALAIRWATGAPVTPSVLDSLRR